jgi:catechol 2,3-dioxygenase-like lactoylglutathione lyase family enzyme
VEEEGMPQRLDHIGVVVGDLEAMETFLHDVLGLEQVRGRDLPDMRTRFYACGEAEIELIEPTTDEGRAARLGDATAKLEHIAIQVDDLPKTLAEVTPKGVRGTSAEPRVIGANLNLFTVPETSGGVQFQFLQKDAVKV